MGEQALETILWGAVEAGAGKIAGKVWDAIPGKDKFGNVIVDIYDKAGKKIKSYTEE